MNTTESIVSELEAELAACDPVKDFMRIKDLRQQINGHGALSRLRTEHESNPNPKLAEQIDFWRRQVWQDIDAPAPKRKRANTQIEPPADPPGDSA